MKPLGAILLFCFLTPMALPAARCGEPLGVGVAIREITPPLGYPMSGYFSARGATGTLDPLRAKAIVFQQGDQRVGLLIADMLKIDQSLADAVRARVSEVTGIPAQRMIIAATHTHTGPAYRTDLARYRRRQLAGAAAEAIPAEEDSAANNYVGRLILQMQKALIDANASIQPMVIRSGAGYEDEVSFNRRFLLKDGTVRTWAEFSQPDVVKAAGPIDPEVGLISFSPTGSDEATLALVNFALHCDTVGGSKYSADFPGHIARVLTKEFGANFTTVFATGTCGDINHNDPTGQPRRSSAEIGEMIAKAAIEAWPSLRKTKANLGFAAKRLHLPLQNYTEEDLAEAAKIRAAEKAGEPVRTIRRAWASKIHKLELIHTGYMLTGRGAKQKFPAPQGPRDDILAEVQVVRLSDNTALVALPGEIFVKLGLAIKKDSPFEHTFVIELANSAPGYVPTKIAYERGGYEATNSIYAPGGGEKLVATALELLGKLHSENP